MNTHIRILGESFEDSDLSKKPTITDLCAVGSLIGLDKNDIIMLRRQTTSSRFKAFLARHWRILLPIVIIIAAVVILVTYILAGNPPARPSSVYPSQYPGVRYNVVKKGDFKMR